jgi:hypothetical protein
MTQTSLQRAFRPIRAVLPRWLSNPIRSLGTAFITPVMFSWKSGHFRSSMKMMAVSRKGETLPWYTYPAIEFLKHRDFKDKNVLEFGGGQSSLWWAARAKQVVTLEGDPEWLADLSKRIPANVDLNLITMESAEKCVAQCEDTLTKKPYRKYDVIVIDGLLREGLPRVALHYVADDGIIICDNAEGYGFQESFKDSGFHRVDFYGYAPGVVLPHSTSIFFKPGAVLFSAHYPIARIAQE